MARTDDARRRTVMDLLTVAAGRVGGLAVWFAVGTVVLPRALGPAGFGLYQACVKAVGLIVGLVGDPVDAAVMRSAPLHVRTDRPRAVAVVRAAFAVRGAAGLAGVAVAAAVPWAASWVLLGTVDHRRLAGLILTGVLGDLLLRSVLGYFQVAETFGRFLVVDLTWQLARAGAVALIVVAGRLSATAAVVVYVAAPYAAFVVGLIVLPRDVRRPGSPRRADVSGVLHAAKWVAVATAAAAAMERLDVLLLQRFRPAFEVGTYAAAVGLAAVPDFLDGIAQTVLAPKVAPAQAAGRFNALNWRYLRLAVPVGLVLVIGAELLAPWGIRTLLRAAYANSVVPFRLLVIGTLFNLAVTPLAAALVNYTAPRAATAIAVAGVVVVTVGGLAVVPRYGAVGAAAIVLAARAITGTATAVVAARVGSRSPGGPLQSPAGAAVAERA